MIRHPGSGAARRVAFLIPLSKQRPGPKSRERADVVEEQNIPDRGAASGYKRLMKFVRRGIEHGHDPRQPGAFSAQAAPIRQRQQSIAQRVPKFLDRKIQRAKSWHGCGWDGRSAEDDGHDKQRWKPAFKRIHFQKIGVLLSKLAKGGSHERQT